MTDSPGTSPLILFADDDVTQRLLIEEYLSEDGYRVAGAADGIEALEKAREQRPDLMILDVLMPRLDGFAVLKKARADHSLRDLPILVVTGLDDTSSIERAFELGATDFMAKPIKWAFLEYRVKFLLRNSVLEKQLRFEKSKAETASQAKSEFLANMSHELRTPLNAIIGFSDVLQRGDTGPEKTKEYSKDINDSGIHLRRIINEILDIAKAESGKLELCEIEFDIAAVVADVARMLRDQAKQAGIALTSRKAEAMPLFHGDEVRVRQILINLLSNAIKFTPSGGRVDVDAHIDEDQNLVLGVTDTGIGMKPEDVSKALAPFSQVDNELARHYEGTGLGLPLAVRLAEVHGGSLTVESEAGVGTTVRVVLPCERLVRHDRPAA